MKISWGKPTILIADLDAESFKWVKLPTPSDGSTQLNTTEGTKTEALVEGGDVEDVKYASSRYQLQYNLRAIKGRIKPIKDNNGVIIHNYAVLVQPEDPACSGIFIPLTAVTVQNTYTAADGKAWMYKHDALKLEDDTNQVKDGVVTITYGSGGEITKVTFKPEDEEKKSYSGKAYDLTSTAELENTVV